MQMLDVREAAALASRNPETIRRWIWSGRLRARREGNRLLVARPELEELLGTRDGSAAVLSLAGWAGEVAGWRAAAGLPRGSGRSAADLVLEDRRARSGTGQESGRDRRAGR